MSSLLLSIILGCALSAACGLRVFIPFICLNLAFTQHLIELPDSWNWVGSEQMFGIFFIAAVIEFIAGLLPVISIGYQSITIPLATISGILIMGIFLLDIDTAINISPLLKWIIAIIFGGAVATLIRTGSIAINVGSHTLPPLMWLIKLIEDILSVLASVAAIVGLIIQIGSPLLI